MIGRFEKVAKWYGSVIGLVEATVEIGPGVTGLLGPNGSGKSTFLKLLTGQLTPSQGTVELMGVNPFASSAVHRGVGFMPEPDAFYDDLTGYAFTLYLTRLHGFGRAEAGRRAEGALDAVGLLGDSRRRVRGYSKGMRQRLKLAQAIAHDPEVLVLDEPLTGMDPVWRRRVMDLVRTRAAAGVAVIVSSHILHEVEGMADQLILLYQGRVKAHGTQGDIRAVLSHYPHRIHLGTQRPKELAHCLLDLEGVVSLQLEEKGVEVKTLNPELLFDRLPELVVKTGIPVDQLSSEDVGLDAIFEYLTT